MYLIDAGQENCVDVRYLIAKNTIDERIWGMIETKLRVVGNALDDKNESLKATSVVSNIDANKKYKNKYVPMVMEKMDNYEERKNRMNRRQDIRLGINVTLEVWRD